MTVARKIYPLRITLDLSVLLISAGMCRAVFNDSNASKMARSASVWLKNGSKIKFSLQTSLFCKRVGTVALGSDWWSGFGCSQSCRSTFLGQVLMQNCSWRLRFQNCRRGAEGRRGLATTRCYQVGSEEANKNSAMIEERWWNVEVEDLIDCWIRRQSRCLIESTSLQTRSLGCGYDHGTTTRSIEAVRTGGAVAPRCGCRSRGLLW